MEDAPRGHESSVDVSDQGVTAVPSAAARSAEAVDVPLPQDLTAPAVARGAVRRLLDSWRLQAVLEPVLLAVSELVTNALRHGRPPVALRLVRTGHSVEVDVHDGSRDLPPGTAGPEEDAESGRGLGIVEAMAVDTGCEPVPDDGKIVWARFEPDGPEARGAQ